jgi:hypothetical protein
MGVSSVYLKSEMEALKGSFLTKAVLIYITFPKAK